MVSYGLIASSFLGGISVLGTAHLFLGASIQVLFQTGSDSLSADLMGVKCLL